MKLSEAALSNLLLTARIDGSVSGEEAELCERYRRALGVSRSRAETLGRSNRLWRDFEAPRDERLNVVEMMVRVAYADGRITQGEEKLLERVAESVGIGQLEFANLLVDVGRRAHIRRKLRVTRVAGVVAALAVVVLAWVLFSISSSRADERSREDRERISKAEEGARRLEAGIEQWKAEFADALHTRSREDEQRVRATALELGRTEKKLVERLGRIEEALARKRKDEGSVKRASVASRAELEKLRKELGRVRSVNSVFKEIEKEYAASVLIIYTRYELASGTKKIRKWGTGTGFFVSSTGHIVSNKHVVKNWLFSAEAAKLVDEGYTVNPDGFFVAAWPAGAVVKRADGALNLASSYNSVAGTLKIQRTTPDKLERGTRKLSTGKSYRSRYHALDHSDLVVLKAEVKSPVKAFTLASPALGIEKLDPVMVLGFPGSISVRESSRAETAPSLGEIRKVEESIFVTAPIVHGNSGGPLLDRHGQVLGVASASYGASTVGGCIPVKHVRALLDRK
ncbi:MAG: trypsin-like peptidase domain-containing protein [Planctomycetota bacterium]